MLAEAPERKAGEAEDDDTANDVLLSAALASSKDADNRIFQLLVSVIDKRNGTLQRTLQR